MNEAQMKHLRNKHSQFVRDNVEEIDAAVIRLCEAMREPPPRKLFLTEVELTGIKMVASFGLLVAYDEIVELIELEELMGDK